MKSFSTGRTGRGQFGYMITIVVPFATLRQIFRNRGELFLHRFLPDFPRTFFFSKSLPSNRKRFAPQRASVCAREKRREQRRSSFFGHELSCLLTIHYLRCSFFLRFFFSSSLLGTRNEKKCLKQRKRRRRRKRSGPPRKNRIKTFEEVYSEGKGERMG